MYALSRDRKKYLLRQNQHFRSANQSESSQPPYAASYGPSSSAGLLPRLVPHLTGDSGLLKRMSVIGWGSGNSRIVASPEPKSISNATDSLPNSPMTGPDVRKIAEEVQPLQPQNTGSLWSSWWTSAGGEKATTSDKRTSQDSKSARWYIDSLKTNKLYDMNLVRHLITLRVHLSTAKLPFIQEFIGPEKGLEVLDKLLAGLVGKGGKRKSLTEIETTVLLEIIKCLRVLLNTDVSHSMYCFRVLFHHFLGWVR
jgi:diaphanous 1